jgi:cyclopropane-fatty-acyl-phospholipid synthase
MSQLKHLKMKATVEKFLSLADISLDGDRPWDIQVHNNDFFSRVLANGSLGLGESYVDSWWDCSHLDQFFEKILSVKLESKFITKFEMIEVLKSKLINLQKPSRSFQVGKKHYDLGNDLFETMLDKRLIYSCGYWKKATNLDQAQEDKLDLVCRKLDLQPGMRVLDLGCGWGGAARFAAERYGVEVVGLTISEQQKQLAVQVCQGLPVEIRLQDYRDLNEKFDRIYSLGMFEHVGYKNYSTYFETIKNCLVERGLFLLHTIGGNITTTQNDPWINRYIFPNGMLPSASQITTNSEGILILEDWHNFGDHYDKTLIYWHSNFNKNWHLLAKKYGDHFNRLWNYYLLCCAGSFRARKNHLWQCVFSRDGLSGGYQSIR